MSQEQMNPMKGSQLKSCLTTRNTQIQIHFLQKLVEEGSIYIILTPELTGRRSTKTSIIDPKPPSTVSEKAKYDNKYLTQDDLGIFWDPDGYARSMDGHALQISIEDIADILQMANGADNLFMEQHNSPSHRLQKSSTTQLVA
ncbi:hypothetical protein F2Q69_00042367 [Brassica cretica]|uniref:Uncharacterized protein n=1 Tax=Brassica cretica TaxID=69181 RepID=A0A8S9NNP2_BRACR|nr:hypothetical protein F2Q69_00042367 [Brassica cretica]